MLHSLNYPLFSEFHSVRKVANFYFTPKCLQNCGGKAFWSNWKSSAIGIAIELWDPPETKLEPQKAENVKPPFAYLSLAQKWVANISKSWVNPQKNAGVLCGMLHSLNYPLFSEFHSVRKVANFYFTPQRPQNLVASAFWSNSKSSAIGNEKEAWNLTGTKPESNKL